MSELKIEVGKFKEKKAFLLEDLYELRIAAVLVANTREEAVEYALKRFDEFEFDEDLGRHDDGAFWLVPIEIFEVEG